MQSSSFLAEFQSADCWYHFSSSMGIKDGVNVHLWFWLERTCSDNELKTWLSGCPVDMRMFNPIQIHLTANPQFSDGAVDPYPNRSGLFKAGTGVSTVTVPSDLAFRRVLSCVDGSFYARVNLSDFDVCRLRSCVRPFDAVDNTAGLDEVRALGPNQISELVSPDSASGCPNFSSF